MNSYIEYLLISILIVLVIYTTYRLLFSKKYIIIEPLDAKQISINDDTTLSIPSLENELKTTSNTLNDLNTKVDEQKKNVESNTNSLNEVLKSVQNWQKQTTKITLDPNNVPNIKT